MMRYLVNSGAIFAVLAIIWCQSVQSSKTLSKKIDISSVRLHISEVMSYVLPANKTKFFDSCLGKMYTCSKKTFSGKKGFRWKEGITKEEIDKFWKIYHCIASLSLKSCPLDGGWGLWTQWSNCTALCMETGTRSRARMCDNPRPARLGSQCSGSSIEKEECQGNCLNSKMMTGYSEATEYLKEIHRLFPQLERECVKGHCDFTYLSRYLDDQRKDRYWTYLICFKHHRACPINGGWATWGSWSSCSTPCGNGYLYRFRSCISPSPRNGGRSCPGSATDSIPCIGKTCRHISGNMRSEFTNWSEFSPCSVSCGKYGTQQKSRTCLLNVNCIINESPLNKIVLTAPCYLGECPVEGHWSDWSEWTQCSAVSGYGRQTRLRMCNNPSSSGEEVCIGPQVETGDCVRNFTSHLSIGEKKSEGSSNGKGSTKQPTVAVGDPYSTPYDTSMEDLYRPWSKWSDCSHSCGGGYRSRTRNCKSKKETQVNEDDVCEGETRQIQFCNVFICQVKGGWSEWSDWTVCGSTCGNGFRYKYRRCDDPLPKHGGSCLGSPMKQQGCNPGNCPKTITKWSLWSEWSECSKTCGGGIKVRVREVINNKKLKETSKSLCEPQACSVGGGWSTWGQWSPCSSSCNLGHHFRDRTCTDPAPINNGPSCRGPGTETAYCYPGPCGENEATVSFQGQSYLTYSPHRKYLRYLLMYLRFKAMQPGGTLLYRYKTCIESTWECKHTITLSIEEDWHLILHVKADTGSLTVRSREPIKRSVWTDVQIGVTWQSAYIRVNDGEHVQISFHPPISDSFDFDASMMVGAEKNGTNGFIGTISVLRINFKEQTLLQSPYWLGAGAPDKQFMVTKYDATDLDVNFPDFRGKHYAMLEFDHNKVLRVMAALRPSSPDGLVLYNEGVAPDSYIVLSMHKGVIKLCFTCSHGRKVCEEAGELRTGQWYFLTLNQEENIVRLRVNRGKLEQVTCSGRKYRPNKTLFLGGVPATYWDRVTELTGITKGYDGTVDVVVVNGERFNFRRAPLFSYHHVLNSMGFSLTARVNDVAEKSGSRVTLRCDFTDFTLDGHKAYTIWLQEDRVLNITAGAEFIPQVPGYRNESSLTLMPEVHQEGLYACLVNQDGRLLITHTFYLHRIKYPLLIPAAAEWTIVIVLIAFVILIFISSIVVLIVKRDTLKHFAATSKYERPFDEDIASLSVAQMERSLHADDKETEIYSADERRLIRDTSSHQSEAETEGGGEYKMGDMEGFTESEKEETKESEEEKDEEDITRLGSAVASRLIEENKDKVLELIASLGNISNLQDVSSKISQAISSGRLQDSQSYGLQHNHNASAVRMSSNSTVASKTSPSRRYRASYTDPVEDIDNFHSTSHLKDRRSVTKVKSHSTSQSSQFHSTHGFQNVSHDGLPRSETNSPPRQRISDQAFKTFENSDMSPQVSSVIKVKSHSTPQRSGTQGSIHSPLGFQNVSHDGLYRSESHSPPRPRISDEGFKTFEESDSEVSPQVSPHVSRRSISKKSLTSRSRSPSPRKSSMILPVSPRSLSASISHVKTDQPLAEYESVKVNLVSGQNDENESQTSSQEVSYPQSDSQDSGTSKPEPVTFGTTIQRTPSRTPTIGLQVQKQPGFQFRSPTPVYSKQMPTSPGRHLYPTRPWTQIQTPVRVGPSSLPPPPVRPVSNEEFEEKKRPGQNDRSRESDSDSDLPQPPTPPTE